MTDSTRLRWGILGAARVNERLLPAIVEAENAELVAIGSRRPGAAAEVLEQYAPGTQGVATLDDPDAVLDDENVQAVYLPMANEEHAAWALRAIERGKHVLVEKPLALRAEDADAIARAAEERGVTVMEGFMYVFHPQFARVQEILRSGAIGDLRSVRSSFSFPMKPARLYRLNRRPEQGGGAMWDVGPYAIHALRSAFGADAVAAVALAAYNEHGADVSTSGVLDFGDGRFGRFDVGFDRARRSEYEVVGTTGGLTCRTVWQHAADTPVISWWTDDDGPVEEVLPAANHFVREIEHFSAAVLGGTPPALSLADARGNAAAIQAVLTSAADGRRVAI